MLQQLEQLQEWQVPVQVESQLSLVLVPQEQQPLVQPPLLPAVLQSVWLPPLQAILLLQRASVFLESHALAQKQSMGAHNWESNLR